MTERQMDVFELKLQDAAVDLKTKGTLLTELRDQLEVLCQPPTYSTFLAKFIPIFLNILNGPPVFTSTSPEQRVRQCILEIIHRMPLATDNAAMEPYAEKIVDKGLELVRTENEDNSVLCLKIVMDFCRYHTKTQAVAEKAQPFLDLIVEIFKSMPNTVTDTFESTTPVNAATGAAPGTPNNTGTPGSPVASASQSLAADLGAEQQTNRPLAKGMHSFKVVAECPIIVVSIFQAHRALAPKNVRNFTPLIRDTLLLQAGPQRKAHEEAVQNNTVFTGVAREIRQKQQSAAFGDMITAQVKTMSFLAYLLRAYKESLNEFLPLLPDLTVRLLRDVPRSHTATRKELLVAIRHIINFNFRTVFLPVILPLLDPRTLVGDSLTADAALRPLAYTMLADLIHHVREQLTPEQIARVVQVYVRNMTGDDGVDVPGTSYQTMSAKLLLNMAECMSKLEDKRNARFLMMSVLNGIADKFAAMNRAYPNAVKLYRQQQSTSGTDAQAPEQYLADKESKPDWDETDIFSAMPIKAVSPKDRAMDPVSENKFLFKNLLQGLKQFFYQLRNSNPPKIKEEVDVASAPPHWGELSSGFEAEEVEVLIKLFRQGAKCFQYYAPLDSTDGNAAPAEPSSSLSTTANSKEEKDLLETFATIFHHLDPATFHEIFTSGKPSGIEFLYEQSFKHSALLHIPQFLLASEATSPAFCGMLLKFLMSKLEEVGEKDSAKTSVLLRLFKLSFMAVTLFSQHNEGVLLPHVRELITRSIELSVTAEEPTNFFLLLRSLFRSIGGGRFEHLYKEILPLLEMLLEVLNTQLAAAPDGTTRDLFVELSLTVPARLSHLLPHLSYLMRPLTVALRSGDGTSLPSQRAYSNDRSSNDARGPGSSELTAQGLRTLELCVDNLTADYLDPIMQPWMEEIMGSLWRMLKPASLTSTSVNNNGGQIAVGTGHHGAHTAVRILGKLGGRNRRFLTNPPDLDWRSYADDEASFDVRFIGSLSNGGERAMPARLGIDTAIDKLWESPKTAVQKKSDDFHKRQSFKFIIAHVKLLVGADNLPDDMARLVRLQAEDLATKNFDFGSDLFSSSERVKSTAKRDAQQHTLLKLLKALFFATSIDILRDDAEKFLQGIYRHFMLIELATAVARQKHNKRAFDVKAGEGPVFVEASILADAICESLASERKEVRDSAEAAMKVCFKITATIFGSEEKAETLPFFTKLADSLNHACYEEEWFTKSSGALGITIMVDKERMAFSESWITERITTMLQALLYVIKDMPQDLPASIRVQAKDTIVSLIKRYGASGLEKKGDFESKDSKLYRMASALVAEVSHMNRHVREAAQLALRTLASVFDMALHELLTPVKDTLTMVIFVKPLRALPFAAQIGYIEAINFLLEVPQDKEILPFDENLNRLLTEALVLVDADDENLAPKPYEYRTAESIVRLRVAGLKLLTTAIKLPGFSPNLPSTQPQGQGQQQQGNQHRARVISIFFKSLYSKNKEVAAAANAGLKIVLQSTSKLPKDLLQNGLRPILMNVQDPRKLSVEGLEGLRTLLQLLHNYFKVEIGTRLLDHMKHIADPPTLQKVSFSLVEAQPKMKIVTAIFSVFHLLPSQAAQFLQDLVDRVLSLEVTLRRTRSSPFREPLIKYLNHYPNEAWTYFSEKLKDERRGRFFAQILADVESGPLREKVIKEVDGLLDTFQGAGTDNEKSQSAVNAIAVVHAICQHSEHGKQLLENDKARKAFLEAAKSLQTQQQQNTLPSNLRLAVMQSAEQIIDIMTNYMRGRQNDLATLFEIFDACTKGELLACPSLFSYLYSHVIKNDSVDYHRSILNRCIEVYTSKDTTQKLKWFVFHNLLNPILANDVMRNWDILFQPNQKGTALLDKTMAEEIHNKLWRPQSVADMTDDNTQGVDHSRMELLQTSAFLIKYHHNMLQDTRKDLIKFGWNYIRLEDHINKFASYCLISYFIHHYETPPKIAMQVYNSLLRAHQTEGRNLVMQSLEVLEPVLKKRLGGQDGRQNVWARLPRKILAEEVGNTQQLTNIFQFVVRHPDLFYEARDQFASIIIPSISKVVTLPSASVENRKLALNLFTLMLQWEERTVKEHGSLAGSDSPNDEPNANLKKGAVASPALRLMLIKYMVQFIATLQATLPGSPPRKETSSTKPQLSLEQELPIKVLDLLYKLLSRPYWDDLDVDAMFPKVTEQILCQDHKQDDKGDTWTIRVVNTVQILKVLINARSDDWVLGRLPQLQRLLAKPLRNENPLVQDALHNAEVGEHVVPKLPPLLQRALQPIPIQTADEELPDADSPTEDFITFLTTTAGELLNNGSNVAAINILWVMAQRKPEDIDPHIPALLKALQTKLAKDHLSTQLSPQAAMAQGIQPNSASSQEMETTTNLIIKVIEMLSSRISTLGETRRPYLSVLASLVERSTNNELCEKILDQVEQWVFNPTEPVPTLKEKTAVLQKMLLFEGRPDQTMYQKFMNLVIRIYEDQKITRSELAVRMEHAFLIGLRSQDVEMRTRFQTIYDKALSRSTSNRFFKLISEQQWDVLCESFWLSQVIQLMFGSFDQNAMLHLHHEDFRCLPASSALSTYTSDARLGDVMIDDSLEEMLVKEKQFMNEINAVRARDVLGPMADLQHTDWQLAHEIWVAYFPVCWSTLAKDDREDIEQGLVALLTKDFHQRQIDRRPNCVSSLLEGIAQAKPRVKFPPHVMKYLAKSYDAWYVAATFMEDLAMKPVVDTTAVRESNLDALVETYASLEESDLFYGTWRRRAAYVETNAALSYEQNGIWDKAQAMYEQAQVKARTGTLPYSAGEYMLWEDQWVLCAQKLQQWDILGEFAKHENLNDLYLEAMWRNYDTWTNNEHRDHLETVIKGVSDAPTPRRMFFQAFTSLLKLHNKTENPPDFARVCDENIQLSIKNWHKLPRRITNAHLGLLQNFQQLVELHDASVICQSLAQTNAANLDVKSQELKVLLSTWRDRLPNLWDDINAWQDLVTWRQHIFQLINGTYLNLLPNNCGNATGNSYAYRGYHETAWIINRFAHVARKHQMPDVCITQLSKIYTLPNIEIQEAFLKLREQAKCHYQNRSELTNGLDVINNTNLNYFGQQQKAEFYTLKGMFLSKLNQKDEASDAFGTALFFDIKLPKAWAEWGRYSDQLFKDDPQDMEKGSNALSCYLEAAGQYKSAKSRKLLSRILWLLSLDDAEGQLSQKFHDYHGDHPWWYWVTFIPQLLNNLSRTESEANIAHYILTNLAKTYPQALHFQLRTSHEDMQVIRRSQTLREQKEKAMKAKQQTGETVKQESPARPESGTPSGQSRPGTAAGEQSQANGNATEETKKEPGQEEKKDDEQKKPKKPWEHTEALVITLRTAFPLLYASMEAMVEQVQRHFKCPPDEDAYRLIVALLNDALSYVGRSPHSFTQENKLPPQTEANITRFAESILPPHIRKAFEQDFVTKKPTMYEYIVKLRRWRDKLAERLDRRPNTMHLAENTHLSSFKFVWFDEVEIPGQYLQHKDKNQDFVRIERFLPIVDLVRGVASCHRRLKIRGHDGSVHPFAIQHPAPRHSRREERVLQLFRIFNSTLSKKKESRRRNLQFHLPVMVPLSPQIRMIQDDESYVTLQAVYEDFCRRNELDKDDPIMFTMDKMRGVTPQKQEAWLNMRMEALNHVQEKMVPKEVVREYFAATYPSYDSFWLFRRQFSYQLAALTYITFTMFMTVRYPNKMHISRCNGNIWGSELLPFTMANRPIFHQPEPVPFRLTPNLQVLMGPIHTEGIFTCALMAIARCLTSDSSSSTTSQTPAANGANAAAASTDSTNCELEHHLSIFIRDEIQFWFTSTHRQNIKENEMREHVLRNAEAIVNKAVAIAKEPTGNNLPASQSVLDLVAKATNPEKLSQTELLWMPWL
ncbi:Transcription-associated protein 1 [Fulvia fulva]|uniref:Transcription-associated protein 1 n=1 Tax=Passalora fulva TaxID=5499 RepID=A0A9Q8UQW2_PASFU|nr:Transcription-associated protein 1 [Fulvia fulva]KAK4622341.1 Transcription-associated protein 1 [Fulvia fulva]KAK4622613.1 Transcription-associated protein 1 [Fulvia fulva]UJO19092.1 Transcription-associated protein 1 [Fulvia fulva]WPV15837.1 Transcription-associated protein 1 [Fulvia fulva]WPV30748.1 Transcription-associated protein 1 [Fulvia fulva]